ncbi:MAG: hypothetical protein AB7L92_03250 [Alphaproteobacteria bacterium]
MPARILTFIALAFSLSACIATPRLEMVDNYTFDHVHVVQQPMSYNDILCCYDCSV